MLQWKKAIWRKTRKILLQRVGAEFYNGLQYQKLLNPASFLVLAFRFAWYKNPLCSFFHFFSFGALIFIWESGVWYVHWMQMWISKEEYDESGSSIVHQFQTSDFFVLALLFFFVFGTLWSLIALWPVYFGSYCGLFLFPSYLYNCFKKCIQNIYICIYCLSSLTVTLYHSHEIAQLPLLACLVFCPCSLVECGMLTKLCYFSCQSNYMAIFRCGSCDLPAQDRTLVFWTSKVIGELFGKIIEFSLRQMTLPESHGVNL